MDTEPIEVEMVAALPDGHNTVTGAIRHGIHQLGATCRVVIEIPNGRGGVDVRTVETVRIRRSKTARTLYLRVKPS